MSLIYIITTLTSTNIAPEDGGDSNFLVDENGNFLVDENGNFLTEPI